MTKNPIDPIIESLKLRNYKHFSGLDISVDLPLRIKFLNFCLRTAIGHLESLKNFKKISIESISEDKVVFSIKHKNYFHKHIEAKVENEIVYNTNYEPLIIINLKKGINLAEKITVAVAKTGTKIWTGIKNIFKRKELPPPPPSYEITTKRITINLSRLLVDFDLDYLNPLLKWEKAGMSDDVIFLKLKIKS